jgi:hypothetical protein
MVIQGAPALLRTFSWTSIVPAIPHLNWESREKKGCVRKVEEAPSPLSRSSTHPSGRLHQANNLKVVGSNPTRNQFFLRKINILDQ